MLAERDHPAGTGCATFARLHCLRSLFAVMGCFCAKTQVLCMSLAGELYAGELLGVVGVAKAM